VESERQQSLLFICVCLLIAEVDSRTRGLGQESARIPIFNLRKQEESALREPCESLGNHKVIKYAKVLYSIELTSSFWLCNMDMDDDDRLVEEWEEMSTVHSRWPRVQAETRAKNPVQRALSMGRRRAYTHSRPRRASHHSCRRGLCRCSDLLEAVGLWEAISEIGSWRSCFQDWFCIGRWKDAKRQRPRKDDEENAECMIEHLNPLCSAMSPRPPGNLPQDANFQSPTQSHLRRRFLISLWLAQLRRPLQWFEKPGHEY
jgi:hypothetical protein